MGMGKTKEKKDQKMNCLICEKELVEDENEIYDGLCEHCFGEKRRG